MKAILCFDDDAALGALQVFTEQGKTDPNEFWLGGVDATPLAVAELQKGDSVYQASGSLLWEYSAVTCSHMLERAFAGKAHPRWLDSGAYIVTRQNVKQYTSLKNGALNPKYSWVYAKYQKQHTTPPPGVKK
jgi:ABC-type sugar transport system substrate-binding protein